MHTVSVELLRSAFSQEQFGPEEMPEVAFAGRSNVGKSSLLNALLGVQIAKVSSTPGRTQSINFYLTHKSWIMVDLPGYGYARVPERVRAAWQPLMTTYLSQRQALMGVVLIIDSRLEPQASDLQLRDFLLSHHIPIFLVATKVDKLKKQELQHQLQLHALAMGVGRDSILPFSSKTLQGRQDLFEAVKSLLIEGEAKMKQIRADRERRNIADKRLRRPPEG